MPLLKVCNRCQRPYDPRSAPPRRGKCASCETEYQREKSRRRRQLHGTTSQRGYGTRWQALVKRAIAAQPWCSYCGSREDLTGDHRVPVSKGGTARSIADVIVACRGCNSARGNRELVGREGGRS
jgi:5-methylcytosine-specific restriction endonuclease McrA